MINLLPYDFKSKISAARANSIIIRYIVVLLISGIFIGLASFVVYYLNQSTLDKISNGGTASSSNVGLQDQELKQADTYIKELKSFQDNILSNEIHYSSILNSLSTSMPSGAIIDQLELSSNNIKNPIKVTIYATSMDVLNSVANALPKDVFTSASMTEQKETSTIYTKYTYVGILVLNINKDLKL